MTERIVKLVFKIAWSVVFLVFINNPVSPLSIPIFWSGEFHFYPIFTSNYVLSYQVLFSFFVLAGILVNILEFIAPGWRRICGILEDIVGIAQLLVIREIPQKAFNVSETLLNNYYSAAYWSVNIIIALTVIAVVIKVIQLLAQEKKKPVNPK